MPEDNRTNNAAAKDAARPDLTNALAARAGALVSSGETAVNAASERERALVYARSMMALQKPRNLDLVRQRLMLEAAQPAFAEKAEFARKVGKDHETGEDKIARGASIRFVEAALRALGNVDVGSTLIVDNGKQQVHRIEVLDLETGTGYRRDVIVEKRVERRYLKRGQVALGERVNSYGERVFIVEPSDDELLTRSLALIAKALRTLGEKLIPYALKVEALAKCREIAADTIKRDPDAARKKVLDSFVELGVGVLELEDYLGHAIKQCSPAEIEKLRDVWSSIDEGETTWSDVLTERREERAKREASTRKEVDAASKDADAKAAAAGTDDPRPAETNGGAGETKPESGEPEKPKGEAKRRVRETKEAAAAPAEPEVDGDPKTWGKDRLLAEIGKMIPPQKTLGAAAVAKVYHPALAAAGVKKPIELELDALRKLYSSIVDALAPYDKNGNPVGAAGRGADPADGGRGGEA